MITTTRVLDIVDMQNDFMRADGGLAVPGADSLIDPANEFFKNLPAGSFDVALFKYDTHFPDEYMRSPESKNFPAIHCQYGTPGWQLAVDDNLLAGKMPVRYMMKNTFDMWQNNPLSDSTTLRFSDEIEERAYVNLYQVSDDPRGIKPGMLRMDFMRDLGIGRDMAVTMIGVASDFCVHDAMLGYLQRGAYVTVLRDLVAGIGTDVPGRAHSGRIEDVMALPVFEDYVAAGQLTLSDSDEMLGAGPVNFVNTA